jgi:ribonuclease Z
MTPTLHPRLLNGRGGDPAVYVEAMHSPGAILFDCGDLSALSARHLLRVEALLVSHTHMDHWADLDRLLRPLVGREKTLRVVGPEGIAARVHHRLQGYVWNLVDRIPAELRIEVTEVNGAGPCPRAVLRLKSGFVLEPMEAITPEEDATVLRLGALRVRTAVLDHGTPVLGFAVEEEAHINVHAARLAERGLPVGPWLAGLKAAVAAGLPDGHGVPVFARASEADGAPVRRLGELREVVVATPGQRVAYLTDFGDTPSNRERAVALARGADTLFIEAPFRAADAAHAADRMHLTTAAAGAIAREAGARRVEPFHLSPRYLGQEAEWLAELEAAFGRALQP